MKRYAELMGNHKKQGIKSPCDNMLDFRGNVTIAVHNDSNIEQMIFHGDRIAQIVFLAVPGLKLERAEELSETARGEGGFGSSGI